MPRMSVFVRTGFWIGFGAVTAAFATGGIDQARAQDSRLGAFLQVGISASAENITFESNSATYAIKKITLQGTSLSNSDLATLLDPKAALSLSERFAKLNASEIAIPELTITTKSAPIQKLTYENIKLSDVKQGRATSADIDGAQFTFTDPKAGSMEGTYGHIHAQNVDLALGAHLMTEARKDDSEPLKTLYESFSVDGLKMKGTGKEGLSLTVGNFTGRNVKGRAFAMPPSDMQAAANDPARAAALVKDIFMSFDMEEMSASDIDVQAESEGKPFSVSLAKMSFANFGNAKIGDIKFENFVVTVQGSSVKIGDVDLKSIDFARLRDLPAKPAPKTDDEASDAKESSAFVPIINEFSMNKVAISIADDNDTSADAKKAAFSIDHFQIDGGMPIETTPTQLTATLDHFILDLKMLKDKDVRSLTDMGYSKLDLSSRIDMAWDAGAEELTIKDVSISGADMGAVKVSGLVDNVTKDFFSGDATAMQAAAFGALVKKIELKIENAGLFEKAAAAQARAQNKSVEEIKRNYVSAAAIGLPAMLDNKPAAKIIGAALAKFAASPKTFHLTAVSADGLGAADFALTKDPVSLLDALDIKATANE
jgi:hypothetical protein